MVVQSPSAVDVDVTVRASRSPYCNADIVGLSTIPERGRGGVITSCRYLGTIDPAQLGWALGLASAGEYLVAVFNPLQVPATGPSDSTENQLDGVDVTIVMPGSIKESNSGQVADRQLRVTDPEVLTLPGGLRVVALSHAGPEQAVWWVGAGAVLGALITAGLLLTVRLFRRRAGRVDAAGDDRPADVPEDQPVGGDAASEGDSPPATDAEAVDDPSVWARPDQRSPEQSHAPDPSRWAPDERP